MNLKNEALNEIQVTRQFFNRSTRCLLEEDSSFRPKSETMTVAGHVAHAAQTLDWFRVGAFEGNWRMDFDVMQAETDVAASLEGARRELEAAWQRLQAAVEAASENELGETLPDNPILPGRPRYHVIEAIVDHTAHHRGALTVYARLAGRVPEMPYGED